MSPVPLLKCQSPNPDPLLRQSHQQIPLPSCQQFCCVNRDKLQSTMTHSPRRRCNGLLSVLERPYESNRDRPVVGDLPLRYPLIEKLLQGFALHNEAQKSSVIPGFSSTKARRMCGLWIGRRIPDVRRFGLMRLVDDIRQCAKHGLARSCILMITTIITLATPGISLS